MKISIIIINYNAEKLIKSCLDSFYHFFDEVDMEIIIVDNSQSNALKELIERNFLKVKLIINDKNVGFGQGNNNGAKIAKGDFLFFLNPDTLVEGNIFQKIIDIFNADCDIGVIAPQIILPDGNVQLWSYGKEGGIWQLIKSKFAKPSKFNQEKNIFEVNWISGAALAIRREIFENIGGFDENFFMYFEDRDLCHRVKDKGYKIIVVPYLKVTHFCGQSIKINKERKKLYYQSQDYFFKKHYGLWQTMLMRFIRLPYRVIFWK